MKLNLKNVAFGAVVGLSLALTAGNATATPSAGPAVPCYKCVFNGSITNPNSRCEMIDTDLYIDWGSTVCTTFGMEGGTTTCETSGETCAWINPFLALTGTGVVGGAVGVVAGEEGDLQNCDGVILAWSTARQAADELGVVVI